MKVYIRTQANGFPETETGYAAWQGFVELGFQPAAYQKEEELLSCRPNDLIVGGVAIVKNRLNAYGITIPEYDYPEELTELLGRKVWTDTLPSVLVKPEQWPIFVKPVKDKAFQGFILRSKKDVPRMKQADRDEPVLCSELVSFCTEWRAFVRYGRIWDVRPYRGNWHYH